jgi:hypothetical protein
VKSLLGTIKNKFMELKWGGNEEKRIAENKIGKKKKKKKKKK